MLSVHSPGGADRVPEQGVPPLPIIAPLHLRSHDTSVSQLPPPTVTWNSIEGADGANGGGGGAGGGAGTKLEMRYTSQPPGLQLLRLLSVPHSPSPSHKSPKERPHELQGRRF